MRSGRKFEDTHLGIPGPILQLHGDRRGQVEARNPSDGAVAVYARSQRVARGGLGRVQQLHVGQPQPLGRGQGRVAAPLARVPRKPTVFPVL